MLLLLYLGYTTTQRSIRSAAGSEASGYPSVFFGISPVSTSDAEGRSRLEQEPSLTPEVSEFLEYQHLD